MNVKIARWFAKIMPMLADFLGSPSMRKDASELNEMLEKYDSSHLKA